MIKNFKNFRLLTESSTSSNLIDQFDDDYIEKYYNKHYKIDLDEIINMSSHQNIMDCFDYDKYKENWIRDYINSYNFTEFDEDDLKTYIKKNIDEEKKDKILEIYNRNNYDEDDEDSEKETDYSDYMINELDKEELQEVIKDNGEEYNCTEWLINKSYSNYDGDDLFDDFCSWIKKDGWYGNIEYGSFERIESSELYKGVSNYIDDDKLKKNWDDGVEFNEKKESVENSISYTPKLQRYLIEKDPDNADALIDLWTEFRFKNKNIGDEYIFQKAYINKYLKDNIADEEDTKDEDYIAILIENALEYLHKKFGINDKISEKYKDHMWKIIALHKFNL